MVPSGTASGTFRLSFRSEVTANLVFDISGSNMETQLELLTTVGDISVTRTGDATNGFFWEITFNNNIGTLPELVVADVTNLIGASVITSTIFSSPSVAVSGTYSLAYTDASTN
jgi:hypothetical protein